MTMKRFPWFGRQRPRSGQRGVSLIELMIGMTIGLALLAALSTLYVSTSSSRTEFDKTATQVENGRYALQMMVRDVEMAGFYGRPGLGTGISYNLPITCAIAKSAMGFSFSAITGATTVPVALSGLPVGAAAPACLTNLGTTSETMTVRYADSNFITPASAVTGEFYVQQSSCPTYTGAPLVYDTPASGSFTLMTKTCSSAQPAEVRKFVVRTYYTASCDNCSGTADTTPTLKVAEFINGAIQSSSLVTGIQDVHYSYGVDTDNNGSPDCYVDNPAIDNTAACPNSAGYSWTNATTNWSNVTAVRISVLARNLQPTTGWTDKRTYDLGRAAVDGPYNDGYKRHVYSAVARVWNVGGLKESQ